MAETMKDHIAIIGAGAWGTALAIQAHRAGQCVMLWARDPARAELIEQSRANERYCQASPCPKASASRPMQRRRWMVRH
jgi:glycerol-3-phosphate dehydrogenase (NAD(P)+)